MSVERRRTLAALALLGATIALLCSPMLLDRSLFEKDILRFTYLQKLYLRERLLHGALPLWWPNDGLGRPFYALVQPGVLYVGNLLLLLPMPHAYDVFSAAHLLLAAFGGYAWLRRCDCDETAAAVGALTFALSGYMVSLFANNGVYVFGAAWIPAILAVAIGPPTAARAGRVALMLALCLSAGDPQALFFAGVALVVQALTRSRADVLVALSALMLTALIGAVVLLPGMATAHVARPGGVSIDEAHHFALHPFRLLELVWPLPFGMPYTSAWNISPLVDEGSHVGYQPLTASIYCGVSLPFFVLLALRTRRRVDIAFAALALVTLVISFGQMTPLWTLMHRFVPLVNAFRFPEKWMMLTTLSFAFLVGRGTHELLRAPTSARRTVLLWLAVAAIGAVVALFASDPIERMLVGAPSHAPRDEALRTLFVVTLLALVVVARRHQALLLAILVASDLLLANGRLVPWTSSQTYRERSPILDEPEVKSAIVTDRPAPRLYRPSMEDYTHGARLPELDRATLLPNCGVEDGIAQLDTYYVFHTRSEEVFWRVLREHPLRLLQWTGTSLALLREAELAHAPKQMTGVHSYPQLGLALATIDGVAPRAYLAQHARRVDDDETAAHLLAGELVPGNDATIAESEPRETSGQCSFTHYAPESLELSCDSTAAGYAIVLDTWFPGWSATVNGATTSILRANATMRGVAIPSGHSGVTMTYAPPRVRIGALLSGLGMLLALALSFRRKR